MKKATIYYPSGKKIIVEIACVKIDVNDILQYVQQGDLQTAVASTGDQAAQELQAATIDAATHGYVVLLVECATESEHDAVCFVYVVPVKLESAKAGISADKIRCIAGEEFNLSVSSLRRYQPDQHASNEAIEQTFSLGSILVANDLCATYSLGPADDRMQHSQEYHHEQQFQVSSPEEAISPNTSFQTQEELRYLLEMENRRKMDHGGLQYQEGSYSNNVFVQREAFNSISFDVTPAFHSNPNDLRVQDFIKPNGNNDDATLTRRPLSFLSISVDSIPAFLSLTPEDQQSTVDRSRVQPIAGVMDLYSSRVDIVSPIATNDTSGSDQSVPLQCTPPARANNAVLVFQRSSRFHVPEAEGGHLLIPVQDQLHFPPHCSQGDHKFVYQNRNQTLYLLPNVRYDGFPSREELRGVPDCTIIYSNPRFTADTHLSCGVDCGDIFPSPPAIQRVVRKVQVSLQNDHRISTQISHHGNSVVPHESAFIGVGGNGIVLKQALNGRKYAIKWTRYNKKELDAWCQLDHPNLVPLCAVVYVASGCYQVMPRMSGDLSCLVRSKPSSDLCTLALCADEVTWTEILRPNIQFMLASILHGLVYLHSQDLQHCDLKESNILFSLKCKCSSILHCMCSPQDKFTIAISDFDSIKPFSFRCQPVSHTGTPYYRPPELTLQGQFADCCADVPDVRYA